EAMAASVDDSHATAAYLFQDLVARQDRRPIQGGQVGRGRTRPIPIGCLHAINLYLRPNAIAQPPGRLGWQHTSEDRNAGPVCCSALFGPVWLQFTSRPLISSTGLTCLSSTPSERGQRRAYPGHAGCPGAEQSPRQSVPSEPWARQRARPA